MKNRILAAASIAIALFLSACVTNGTYTDEWQTLPYETSRISWDDVKGAPSTVKIVARADSTQYEESHLLNNSVARTELWVGLLTRQYKWEGKVNDVDFKDSIRTWPWIKGKEIAYGRVIEENHSDGRLMYSKADIGSNKCIVATLFAGHATDSPGSFEAKVVGFSCLKSNSQASLDRLIADMKKLELKNPTYDGTGIPVDKPE